MHGSYYLCLLFLLSCKILADAIICLSFFLPLCCHEISKERERRMSFLRTSSLHSVSTPCRVLIYLNVHTSQTTLVKSQEQMKSFLLQGTP